MWIIWKWRYEWWLFCHQKSCLSPEFLFQIATPWKCLGEVIFVGSVSVGRKVMEVGKFRGFRGGFLVGGGSPKISGGWLSKYQSKESNGGGVGFCGFWDQILRGHVFFFFRSRIEHFRTTPWFSRKKLGKGLEDENFSKKKNLISHEAMIMGGRVEVSLNTIALGKLVGWYFVKSSMCLPLKYNMELATFVIWIWSLCICLGLFRKWSLWIVRWLLARIYRSVASTFFFLISHPVIRWPSVSPTWCLKFKWS